MDSLITTAPAPAADGPSTAPARLSPALIAAGLGAVVAATATVRRPLGPAAKDG